MASTPGLTAEQTSEALRSFECAGQLEALAYVHRATHMGLVDAMAVIAALPVEQAFFSADWLAVGEFRPELARYLEYPDTFYAQTRPGARLVVNVLTLFDPGQVQEMADCLGVDPFDFNTHVIEPARVRLELLRAAFDGYPDDLAALAETFAALRDAGFQFHFRLASS
jgi:hypothetical protein